MNKYQVEDNRLRTVHLQSLAATSADGIVSLTGCSYRDGWRLALVRERSSVLLIDAWLRGQVRFRTLLRLACDNPDDPHAQVLAANLPSPKKTVDSRPPSAT